MAEEKKKRDGFGSKLGIIAAAAGSAIGLGNIYRFPCEMGNHGGGVFLLVYLAVVIFLGIPVMMSELVIGRRSQSNSVGAFKKLAPKSGWPIVGYIGVLCGFIIFAFYSTLSGWIVEYIVKAVSDSFNGMDDPSAIEQEFQKFQDMGWRNVIWQTLFIILTGFVVFKGVQNGIEKYTKILMPLLLIILIILAVRSLTLDGAMEGLSSLFKLDFSKGLGEVVLSALGQGFFSLSLGMGVMITYGSYVKKNDNLTSTALSVVLADTLIAVLAGLIIFPTAYSFHISVAGDGLVFNTLPLLFNKMPGGYWFCIIFFVLLAIAALTSTISLLEVIVAYISEELHMKRQWATVVACMATIVLGAFASLSLMSESPFVIGGQPVFKFMDFVSSNILLPLGGLLIVIFVGWKLGKKKFYDEVTNEGKLSSPLKKVVFFIIKYLAPLAITIVLISGFIKKEEEPQKASEPVTTEQCQMVEEPMQ